MKYQILLRPRPEPCPDGGHHMVFPVPEIVEAAFVDTENPEVIQFWTEQDGPARIVATDQLLDMKMLAEDPKASWVN